MSKKPICLISLVLVLGLVLTSTAKAAESDLAGYWKFDEGSGTTAHDSSGNENDGTLVGGAQWVAGNFGGAIQFNGSNAYVTASHIPLDSRSFTVTMWVNPVLYTSEQIVFSQGTSGTDAEMHFRLNGDGSVRMGFYNNDLDTPGGLIKDNNWYHITFWYDFENQNRRIYIDGELEAELAASPYLGTSGDTIIGSWHGDTQWFQGIIDDVRIYNRILSDVEILGVMAGSGAEYPFASGPDPADGALLMDTWISLGWRTGDFAVSHDVYFGENFDDVNNGTGDTFRGNQDTLFYLAGFTGGAYPDGLVNGMTYYWRIDGVNDTNPNSPWKGEVWSFTVPPKSAYEPNPADGAEFVDLNVQLEWTPGYKAMLHYITFGDNFDDVNNATDGTMSGITTYSPGPLELAKTYYWRVDENDGNTLYKGKVWSFTTEGAVSSPNPADGALDANPSVILTWDAGLVAASHEVYFGTDADAVANATKTSPEYKVPKALGEESYDPGKLTLNTTYYWRIDEVNDASPDSPWTGNVWSFTTGDFFVIDNFEIYDTNDNQIWWSWKDGLGYVAHHNEPAYSGNGTGSAVGDESTLSYTEETIVHGGLQSMPLMFDNNKQNYANYSEAELTLTDQRDWTEQGVTELSLWFRGNPGSVGSFVEAPFGTYTMTASGADIWYQSDEFHFAYKTLSGQGSILAKVESLSNTDNWAKAGVMIRETLNADSKHAMMIVSSASGVSFQRRLDTGGDSSSDDDSGGLTAPYWVKIERDLAGNFSAYSSANGSIWQKLGVAEPIQMDSNVFIGLAVTSHNESAICQAVISNVTFSGNVAGQWASQNIGIESNDIEPLYVAVSNSAGVPAVVVNDDPAASQIGEWTEWTIPLQAFADQGINLANVDRIAIGLGIRGNIATPGGSGTMYIDDIRLYQPGEAAEE